MKKPTKNQVLIGIALAISYAMACVSLVFAIKAHKAVSAPAPHRMGAAERGAYVPSGTGFLHITSGVEDSAAAAAGGSPAGSTNELQTNAGGGVFGAATNVLGGSGFISIGATPAGAGSIRLPYNGASAVTVLGAKDSGGGDIAGITYGSGQLWEFGNTTQETHIKSYDLAVSTSVGLMLFQPVGALTLAMDGTSIMSGQPIVGYTTNNSPYGVHGDNIDAPTANPAGGILVLTAAQYSKNLIAICNTILGTSGTGGGTVQLPPPATFPEHGYQKWIYNGCQASIGLDVVGGGNPTQTVLSGKFASIYVYNNDNATMGVICLTPNAGNCGN